MNAVITSKQAKQITGGRTPLTIVPYETAVKALRECLEFDDVKYWDNLADAYAAWAKIKGNDQVMRLAKALKLKAAERVGQIALQLRPATNRIKSQLANGRINGTVPGANKLLKDMGMTINAAAAALALAKMPIGIVDKAANSPRPPTPNSLYESTRRNDWGNFTHKANWSNMHNALSATNARSAARMAGQYVRDMDAIRKQAVHMYEWLDEFIHYLPKAKKP